MRSERRRLLALGAAALAAPAFAALPDLIARARRSVLPLGTYDPLASPRFDFRGTSFVVGDGRYIVSNQHVTTIKDVKSPQYAVLVRRPDGDHDVRAATLVAQDGEHDLVLLRLVGATLPALTLAADDGAREGQAIALMGFPVGGLLGFQPVTHRGIISSIAAVALPAANADLLSGTAINAMRRGVYDVYQLDATAYPGNSGGPVFDADSGEVVAAVNKVLVQGTRESALQYPSGISYAIPVKHVRALVDAHAR